MYNDEVLLCVNSVSEIMAESNKIRECTCCLWKLEQAEMLMSGTRQIGDMLKAPERFRRRRMQKRGRELAISSKSGDVESGCSRPIVLPNNRICDPCFWQLIGYDEILVTWSTAD